mgnify:CR=1 FL=1
MEGRRRNDAAFLAVTEPPYSTFELRILNCELRMYRMSRDISAASAGRGVQYVQQQPTWVWPVVGVMGLGLFGGAAYLLLKA